MKRALIRKQSGAGRAVAPVRGTESSLGLAIQPTHELIRRVQQGLPYKALETLSQRTGIPTAEIATVLDIPPRTLARRKAGQRFAREESERLVRIARIFEGALDLFQGDVRGAVSWLRTPRKALGQNTPLDYSGTELGAREVETLIGQLAHGVFA